ncbi:hypothetical protein GCM10009830_04820 [Glycomyces endophyticus]|uniref:Uncharacterized protein n=1 Tax=Glycomyces endophyticus TaxID=480996 RepID=A0ABN2G0E4_9ACTN
MLRAVGLVRPAARVLRAERVAIGGDPSASGLSRRSGPGMERHFANPLVVAAIPPIADDVFAIYYNRRGSEVSNAKKLLVDNFAKLLVGATGGGARAGLRPGPSG